MPIQYTGVVEEHMAVRETVGVFDVSHLGNVDVAGPGANAFVNSCLTNDLDRIGPGQAQYTLCCDESGGVVDDLIVYYGSPEALYLVPNAANTPDVVRRLRAPAPSEGEGSDPHEQFAIIAVQGPRSRDVLAAAGVQVDLDYMAFTRAADAVICRTGYTGEHGYEIVVPVTEAIGWWDRLLASTTDVGGRPCGLGARDTLRTE